MSATPPRPPFDGPPEAGAHDPFAAADGGATIIRPNPGGRPGGARPAPSAAVPPAAASAAPSWPEQGLNPLVTLLNPLLGAVPQIRATRHLADPAVLRQGLAQALREFGTTAAAQGLPPQQVMAARYVMCTLLDEAANDTPWGGGGVWGQHSLLVTFHNESWGGEKVFQLMARLAGQPAEHRDLLELIYVALALGFEGRFRAIDNGRAQLEAVREKLAGILQQARPAPPAALAQHWQVEPVAQARLPGWLPLLVGALATALLLTGVYVAMSFSLGARSDPVFGDIQGLRLAPPAVAVRAEPPPAPAPRLAGLLQPEIAQAALAVRDEIDRSVVTLRGDGLFEPGSAALAADKAGLLRRVAAALTRFNGPVLVTGHTDSQPIRSARFPSNWHLSQERAATVRALLIAGGVAAARVRAEGRADGEPLVANDTPAQRAQNRRVEVTLFVAPPAAPTAAAAPPAAAPSGARP